MYISIQKNIHCEPCKKCGTRPVVEQLPKAKFKVICPSCGAGNNSKAGLVKIDAWNQLNMIATPGLLRKVS